MNIEILRLIMHVFSTLIPKIASLENNCILTGQALSERFVSGTPDVYKER